MTRCRTCGWPMPTAPKSVERDDAAWQAFLDAWWERFGCAPVPARELFELPEARAVRGSLIGFAQAIGKAWRSGEAVNGRQVVLVQWGHSKIRGRTKKKRGVQVCYPTLWALEEAPASSNRRSTPA